jgi:hypothetical protein
MGLKAKVVVSTLAASLVVLAGAFTGCTSILGDFEVGGADTDAGEGGGDGGDLGKTCAQGTECSTGFCVDGVCCESACSGTCETCNGASKGKCEAVADGQDPGNECQALPLPDAGVPDAALLDAGDGGEGGLDDDSGVHIPDGGVASDDAPCKGSCDGNRKCKYPGKEKSCGGKFCNDSAESAHEVCDGKGHCDLSIDACVGYACVGDDCKTTCATPTDCRETHFCNSTGVCQEKLGDSITCQNPDQCKSGFCANNVCCDTACDPASIPGATCIKPGSVGKCQCNISCPGASCTLVYRDQDGDGFGDKFGTVGNGKAQVVCDNAIPPGWLLDHTDCADSDANAKPGQTAYFGTQVVGVGGYDYNCNGSIEKSVLEYPGVACHFCDPPVGKVCDNTDTTCPTSGQSAKFDCPLSSLCFFNPGGGITCSYSCGGIFINQYRTAFTSNIACGATGTTTTCGTCTAPNGTVTGNTTTSGVQQLCH